MLTDEDERALLDLMFFNTQGGKPPKGKGSLWKRLWHRNWMRWARWRLYLLIKWVWNKARLWEVEGGDAALPGYPPERADGYLHAEKHKGGQ